MNQELGQELGWDDTIEQDGNDFILLPPGDYDFKVESFERGRFAGSEKMSACNMATLNIVIEFDNRKAFIKHKLFLNTKTEWALSQFFASIGLKKKGEKLKMNWNQVPGSIGRCQVDVREWKKDDGSTGYSNEIKKFYPQPEKTYTAGTF